MRETTDLIISRHIPRAGATVRPSSDYKTALLLLRVLYGTVPHIALKLHSPHLSRIQSQYPLLIMAVAAVEYRNVSFRVLINNDAGSGAHADLSTWRPERKYF